jgi:hypothetical protein
MAVDNPAPDAAVTAVCGSQLLDGLPTLRCHGMMMAGTTCDQDPAEVAGRKEPRRVDLIQHQDHSHTVRSIHVGFSDRSSQSHGPCYRSATLVIRCLTYL